MKEFIAYTDGGADYNPGKGGWAFYIEGEVKVYGYGGEKVTNNEMELIAMTQCLDYIGRDRKATIFSDSTYVIKGLTEWIYGWMRRGWQTSSGTPVQNKELWQTLFSKYNDSNHKILFVKGHSGNHGNEICDQLVQEAKESQIEYYKEMLRPEISVNSIIDSIRKCSEDYDLLSEYDKRNINNELYSTLVIFTSKVRDTIL